MNDKASAPTLTAGLRPGVSATPTSSQREATSLLDLMTDGFYMVFLLKNRYAPTAGDELRARVREFLTQVERGARRLSTSSTETSSEDLHLAKYAFCALIDEIVLSSQSSARDVWMRKPLQLELFGEQLAGTNFFVHLDELRRQGAIRLPALEVFHMCLLLGFQGKYILEDGSEKLAYLCDRVGDEIAHHKGHRPAFAPHWQAPDRVIHRLRTEVPLWVLSSVFALAGLAAFVGLRWSLAHETQRDLAGYTDVVKLSPPAAHVSITLP